MTALDHLRAKAVIWRSRPPGDPAGGQGEGGTGMTKARATLCTDIAADMLALAHRRTAFLVDSRLLLSQPLSLTLASAYLQGIRDAADAQAHRLDLAGSSLQA